MCHLSNTNSQQILPTIITSQKLCPIINSPYILSVPAIYRSAAGSTDGSCNGLTSYDVIATHGDLHRDTLRHGQASTNQYVMAASVDTSQEESVRGLVWIDLV